MRRSTLAVCAIFLVTALAGLWTAEARAGDAPAARQTIVVDAGTTHQTIEGWGGNIYPAAVAHQQKDPTLYDKAFAELKTTHVRVRSSWYELEAENDNADPEVIDFAALKKHDRGTVHDEFLLQKAMAERGIKLLFASWRFPYWMIGKPADWKPKSEDRPALPVKMEAELVESMAAYMLYARKEYGFTFDAVSVANEPLLGIYVRYDAAGLVRVVRALKDRLAKEKYETRFYCPDVTPGDATGLRRAQSFFAQRGAQGLSCCVAYHSYRPDLKSLNGFRALGRELKLPVWVTEQNYTSGAPADRFEWSHALRNAAALHDLLTESDATLSLHWSYVAGSEKGLVIYNPQTRSWGRAYDMLKLFHNSIPAGSVRVEAAPARTKDGVQAAAFQLPGGSGTSVVLVNAADRPRAVRLSFKAGAAKVVDSRRSDSRTVYQPVPGLAVTDGRDVDIELPKASVTALTVTSPVPAPRPAPAP